MRERERKRERESERERERERVRRRERKKLEKETKKQYSISYKNKWTGQKVTDKLDVNAFKMCCMLEANIPASVVHLRGCGGPWILGKIYGY